MTSPALGIAYCIWLRLRWVFVAVLVLLPTFAVLIRLFPATAAYCQFASAILFFSGLLPLFNACTFGPTDLGARTSGFPRHMFVLPLSNWSLVGWPMLYGAIILGGLWVLVAVFVFVPTDVPLPVGWPASILAAICVWMQAIGWTPFPSPYIRVPALVIGVGPLILFPLVVGIGMPPSSGMVPFLLAWSLIWSLVGFAFAVRGVSRARTGSEGDWIRSVADRLGAIVGSRVVVARERRPFQSAEAAQLWHEFRRNTFVMPLMLGFMGIPISLATCLSLIGNRQHSGIAIGSVNVSPPLLALIVCIGLPVLLSAAGGGIGKFDVWGKEQMPSFFAIRPMTTAQFIRIKLVSATISTLSTWAIMIAMVVFWAVLEASRFDARESIVRNALEQATPRTVATVAIFLLLLAAVMVRNVLAAMWTSLVGRTWLSVAAVFIGMTLIGGTAMAGSWAYQNPDLRRHWPAVLPWVVALLLAAKIIAATAVGIQLRRLYLLPANRIVLLYGRWLLLAAAVLGLAGFLVTPTWITVAGVALMVPFTRVAVFPLALDWNRHR